MEILNYLIDFFTHYGYFAVFIVLIACGIGLPIPEDITLIAGGVICVLSYTTVNVLSPEIMTIIALSGVLIGDSIMFLLGYKLGHKVTRIKGIRNIITPTVYEQIQEKIHRYGDKILFFARFLPGLRAPIFIISGVSHRVSYIKFIVMDGLAAIISVPLLVYVGYFFANDLETIVIYVKHSEWLIIGLFLTIILAFFVYKKYIKK